MYDWQFTLGVAVVAMVGGALVEQRSWLPALVVVVVVAFVIAMGPARLEAALDPTPDDDYDPVWDDEHGEEIRVRRVDPRKPW